MKNFTTMARQIKETPVLKGKDAQNFINKMELSSTLVLPIEEIQKMQKDYQKISNMISDKNVVRI